MSKNENKFWQSAKSIRLRTIEQKSILLQILELARSIPFLKSAKKIELESQEHAHAFSALFSHMKKHPLRVSEKNLFQNLSSIFSLKIPAGMLLASLLVITGGGFAYASEQSLPGDILYPLKVSVTEPIREVLQFTPEKKAAFSLRRMERRMQEAETLVLNSNLDPKLLESLDAQIEVHSHTLETQLRNLPSPVHAEEIRTKLRDRIEKSEKRLQNLRSTSDAPAEVEKFIERSHIRKEEIIQKQKVHEERIEEKLQDLRKEEEERIDEIREYIHEKRQEILQRKEEILPVVTSGSSLDLDMDPPLLHFGSSSTLEELIDARREEVLQKIKVRNPLIDEKLKLRTGTGSLHPSGSEE